MTGKMLVFGGGGGGVTPELRFRTMLGCTKRGILRIWVSMFSDTFTLLSIYRGGGGLENNKAMNEIWSTWKSV